MADLKSILKRPDIHVRFWSKVVKGPSCWTWAGAKDEHGYGRLNVRKLASLRAHRISAAMHLGDYAESLVVRHTCDNPACCNPDHLVMGTQADNIADREARGRGNHESKFDNLRKWARSRRKSPHTASDSGPIVADGVGFEPT